MHHIIQPEWPLLLYELEAYSVSQDMNYRIHVCLEKLSQIFSFYTLPRIPQYMSLGGILASTPYHVFPNTCHLEDFQLLHPTTYSPIHVSWRICSLHIGNLMSLLNLFKFSQFSCCKSTNFTLLVKLGTHHCSQGSTQEYLNAQKSLTSFCWLQFIK